VLFTFNYVRFGSEFIICMIFVPGFGLFATKNLSHGDFVVEYAGKVISAEMGDNVDDQTYIYHFQLQGQHYW